jgi:hypothetical protein
MSDHKHGSMDTTVQEETFNGFIKASMRVVIACIVLAIFLAIFRT